MAKKKKKQTRSGKQGPSTVRPSSDQSNGAEEPNGGHNKHNATNPSTVPDRIIVYCFFALVFILPLVFIYQTLDIFELSKLTFLRLVTLTLLGAWAWKIYGSRRVAIARTPLDYFILIYLGVFTLATIFSKNFLISVVGDYVRYEGVLTILNYGVVFFLAGSLLRNNPAVPDIKAFVRRLILAAIAAADLVAIYGIFQRFGLDFYAWSNQGSDITRAFSTMGNPIYVAAYLTIVLSLSLALFVGDTNIWTRLYLGISSGIMFLCLVFTFSRAGWLGFLLSVIVLVITFLAVYFYQKVKIEKTAKTSNSNRLALLLSGVLLIITVIATAMALSATSQIGSGPTKSAIQRALSSVDVNSPGAVERISLWKSALAMIKDRPLLGWGPATFGTYYPRYRRMDLVRYDQNVMKQPQGRVQNRPHSDLLQQGVSAGLLGLAAYCSLFLAFFFWCFRLIFRESDPWLRALLIGILSGLAGFLAQIQFSFSTIGVNPLVWLLMAVTFLVGHRSLTARGSRLAATRTFDLSRVPRPVLLFLPVLITLVLLAGAIISLRPLIADYYFDQGVYKMDIPDPYGGSQNFDQAIAWNPWEPDYMNYAGNSFVEGSKSASTADSATAALTKAISYLDRAVALNPDVGGYRYNLANADYYYSMLSGLDKTVAESSMREALRNYLLAVAADPLDADIHFNLASAYMRFNQKQKAIAELKIGLYVNPKKTQAATLLKNLKAK